MRPTVAKQLAAVQAAHDWTRDELAERLGVHPSRLSAWKKGSKLHPENAESLWALYLEAADELASHDPRERASDMRRELAGAIGAMSAQAIEAVYLTVMNEAAADLARRFHATSQGAAEAAAVDNAAQARGQSRNNNARSGA